MSYVHERKKWIAAGKPVRSPERVAELFDNVCSPCEYFVATGVDKGVCGLCRCSLKRYVGAWFNKLEWGTTRCPAKKPRWVEE